MSPALNRPPRSPGGGERSADSTPTQALWGSDSDGREQRVPGTCTHQPGLPGARTAPAHGTHSLERDCLTSSRESGDAEAPTST